MPKTKFQDLVFTIIMVFMMVYVMTFYNAALEHGLDYSLFDYAIKNMWPEAIGAFIAQRYIAGPFVRRQVARLLPPGSGRPLLTIIAMAGLTASMMAPMMTLFVTLLHHGFVSNALLLWLNKLYQNFPFALCIQIFYVGPLVRLIFHMLFRKQLAAVTASSSVTAVSPEPDQTQTLQPERSAASHLPLNLGPFRCTPVLRTPVGRGLLYVPPCRNG
jgi:hypothetical protein